MNTNLPFTQKISLLFFSALFGGGLSVLVLFNLPLFYEQDRSGWIRIFLITFVILSVIIALSHKLLLIPLAYFKEKDTRSILFIISLSLILTCIFYFTTSYYWATPKFQQIEICYESNDSTEILKINSILDYRVGRVYSARIFGQESFPVSIPANTCTAGGVRTVQEWRGIILNLDEKGGDDFIIVKVNRQNTLWTLADNDGVATKETITIPASAHRGSPIYPNIFSSGITIIIKWISLLLSSFYLAALVFALAEIITLPGHEPIVSHKIGLILVLILFVGFGLLMTQHGGQPDQGKHLYFSSRYSETWGFPREDPQSPYFVQDNVYFYYWVNGAVIKISRLLTPDTQGQPLARTDIFLLRIFSVLLSVGTLLYVYKLTAKVTENKWGGVLAAFFYANILMFVFISGGISFDTFVSLSSVAALFHLVCLLQQEDYTANTAWMGIWLCLGALSKNEGALLAFILFLAWLLYSIIARNNITIRFNRTNLVLIVLLAVTSGLFLEFYGGNLVQYHRPIPKCEQLKSEEACTRFAFRRELRQEVDYSELWEKRNFIVGPFEYAMNYWLFNMINGIWGIVSHNTYVPKFTTSLHSLLIIWCIFCMARYWKKENIVTTTLLLIILCYAGYVFFLNYRSELVFNFRHFAVQGRYLFPVLSAFITLLVNYLLSINSQALKKTVVALTIILYFAGGLGTFVFSYSDIFIAWRIFF